MAVEKIRHSHIYPGVDVARAGRKTSAGNPLFGDRRHIGSNEKDDEEFRPAWEQKENISV